MPSKRINLLESSVKVNCAYASYDEVNCKLQHVISPGVQSAVERGVERISRTTSAHFVLNRSSVKDKLVNCLAANTNK